MPPHLRQKRIPRSTLRNSRKHPPQPSPRNKKVIPFFPGRPAHRVEDRGRLALAVDSTNTPPDEAHMGRLESLDIREARPRIRGKLLVYQRSWGSDQMV